MAKNKATLDEWRRLYEATIQIKEIAPWEWMSEMDVFGVRDPETGDLGFVSVMGALGEHFSIAVYLGPKGVYGFWDLEDTGPNDVPERLLEIPQLQASFENRNELHKKDRDIIKQLGLKFRGRQAWPMFRSYRPGFAPWFLEPAEIRFLACVLEQATDVTNRFLDDPGLLESLDDDESYLVRVSQPSNGSLTWEDQMIHVSPPEPEPIPLAINVQALKHLKQLSKRKVTIEIDFFLAPMPVQENRDDRPYFPYVLMVVEAQNGFILGTDMLQPEPSLEAMWGQAPGYVVQLLAQAGIRPAIIKVRTNLLRNLLKPLVKELGFKLKQSPVLPTLDEAKGFMFQRFF